MKNIFRILILCSLLGCELVLDIDQPNFQPSLVINGFLTPDSVVRVVLSKNSYVLDDSRYFSNYFVDGAEIQLFENNELIGTFSEDTTWDSEEIDFTGLYYLDYFPKMNMEYRIEARRDGYEPISVSERLESRNFEIEINSVDTAISEWGGTVYEITTELQDSPGNDFYELSVFYSFFQPIYSEDTITKGPRTVQRAWIETDNLVFEDHLPGHHMVFKDDLFEGESYQIKFDVQAYYFDPNMSFDPELELIVTMRSTTESYYNYHYSTSLQRWVSGDPFAQPVQVYSNVSNGFGILAGYQSKAITFEIGYEYWERY